MTAKNASWPARLSAAFYVLGACGVGPQQSGVKAATVAALEAGEMTPDDLRAFVAAGARAVALRQAAEGAVDAEVIEIRPASVTPDPKP